MLAVQDLVHSVEASINIVFPLPVLDVKNMSIPPYSLREFVICQLWGAANPNQFHIISVIQSLDPNCTLDSFLCNLVILSWSDRLKVPMTSIQEKSAVITMLIVAQDPDTQNGKP